MKKINFLIITIVAAIFSFFISCEKPDVPPLEELNTNKIITVSDIYDTVAKRGEYTFTEEYFVYGTIIMDDSNGNIYKEAYLQDTVKGVNLYHLKTAGAVTKNSYVRINLKNVVIKDYSGKIELDFDNCDNPKSQIITIIENAPIRPKEVSINDILTGEYVCELVKITDVQFADTTLTYATANGTSNTSRNLMNCEGKTIIVRSSDQSDFAGQKLASGKGSIEGVMTKFIQGQNTVWQLLISDISKVEMNEHRCN
ncbi:MAG: DUF5689 domain-containing protein [Bacteroidales bacterium]|jgi:hypothetical protein|nr:DUF5689 domain-containing protein [Bacteroidales bacterium]